LKKKVNTSHLLTAFIRKLTAFIRKLTAFIRKLTAFIRKLTAFIRKLTAFIRKLASAYSFDPRGKLRGPLGQEVCMGRRKKTPPPTSEELRINGGTPNDGSPQRDKDVAKKKERRPPKFGISAEEMAKLAELYRDPPKDETGRRLFWPEVPAGPLGEAQHHNALGFTARLLVLATLPHSDPGDVDVFGRSNGGLSYQIQAGQYLDEKNQPRSLGIPYGTIPRLLLCWLTSEAVRTRDPEIYLGKNLSRFMEQLGMIPSGGRWGSIPRLREQMKRLFSSQVSYVFDSKTLGYVPSGLRGIQKGAFLHGGVRVATHTRLFWDEEEPEPETEAEGQPPGTRKLIFQPVPACLAGKPPSTVTLGLDFFREVINRPVPLDMRTVQELGHSPLALDIYCWLTYRVSYMNSPSTIPWEALSLQFGANYDRLTHFKASFLARLKDVQQAYPQVRLTVDADQGLTVYPSRPHVHTRGNLPEKPSARTPPGAVGPQDAAPVAAEAAAEKPSLVAPPKTSAGDDPEEWSDDPEEMVPF
jgi:hypothetical protein